MKTTISGPSTTIEFTADEIDDLLRSMIRDGYLHDHQGDDDGRMWWWLERAVAWRQNQPGDPMNAPELGVIFRKMFEWRAFVFRGEQLPRNVTDV